MVKDPKKLVYQTYDPTNITDDSYKGCIMPMLC